MPTRQPNLLDHLPRIAAVADPAPFAAASGDPLALGWTLSGERILQVYLPGARPDLSNGARALGGYFSLVDDPDDADVALVLHTPGMDALVTAQLVEAEVVAGRRVVLADVSQGDGATADPHLLTHLTATTVYVSNLAAYDVDFRRALAAALTPLRDGAAHRLYLAETMVWYWAWQSIVVHEARTLNGDPIPEARLLRATTQAKSRVGAFLLRLRARGLRYFVREVGFDDRRIDGFWFDLEREA